MKLQFGGIGMFLFAIFLTLKLAGTIAWSWWWITAPLWIPGGIAIVIFIVASIIAYNVTKHF